MDNAIGPVLVTGGDGFIGRYLVQRLRARGETVIALDNLSRTPWSEPDARVDARDVLDIKSGDIDGIRSMVHLACRKVVPTSFEDPDQLVHNVRADRHLVGLIVKARPAKVLLASSCEVYGAQQGLLSEGSRLCPRSPYAVGKVAMELLADVYRPLTSARICAVRLFNVYGPGESLDAVVPRFVHDALARGELTIEGSGRQARDFTYVDDVVRALVGLLSLAVPPPVVNIASGATLSVRDLARKTRDAIGPIELRSSPARRNEIGFFNADTSLLKRTLPGWHPEVTIDEGLRRCIGWQRSRTATRPVEACSV
jgi:dTDP-glucose 4,6-dehydratase/UDP-glucose 4-epimerase